MNIKSDLVVNQSNIRSYLQTSMWLLNVGVFGNKVSRMDLELWMDLVLMNWCNWQGLGAVWSGSDKS